MTKFALIFAALLQVAVVQAAPATAPRLNGKVNLDVSEQSLPAFLHELFGAAGYATVMSSSVSGRVDGRVEGTLDAVLRDVARKYAVTFYYVDKVVFVYSNAELGARVLPTKPAQADALKQRALDRRMIDSNNYLARADNGTLVAIGTPRFLDQLDDMAASLAREPATVRKTPSTAELAASEAKRLARLAAKRAEQQTARQRAATESAARAAAAPTTQAVTAPLVPVEVPASAPREPVLPSALTPPVSLSSGNNASQSTASASASRAPLRPNIVWRSAYATPEPGEAKAK